MLTTIKGIYDHGKIIMSEEAPVETKTDVIITFLTEEKTEIVQKEKKQRVLGILEGKIKVPEDFNEPLDDLKDYM